MEASMASELPDNYPLGRDQKESDRLREQHEIVLETTGYLIHPTILDRLPSNARIADVAAGNGVWASDAAKLLPNAQVVAYDISSAQFPPHSSSSSPSGPGNLRFVVADARKSFPEPEHGTFDMVHIRALVVGLQPEDWDTVMQNIVQLLKPGGSVQWYESDLGNLRCLRNSPDYVRYNALPKLLEMFSSIVGTRLSDPRSKLPGAAFTHLDNVEVDNLSSDRNVEARVTFTRQAVVAFLSLAEKNSGWSADELKRIKAGVITDLDHGAYIRADLFCVIGTKPHALTE